VSIRANAMTDLYCLEGIRRVLDSLRRACEHGSDLAARTEMSFASLLGGLALSNAGLGVVHGFAAPIGGMFDAPHGSICAALLPYGIAANIRALRARSPESQALARYAAIEPAISSISQLISDLQIPRLSSYGIGPEHVDKLCESASRASSMKANPIVLSQEELREMLSYAF
jgi:alcohol dehydrogenase class IV